MVACILLDFGILIKFCKNSVSVINLLLAEILQNFSFIDVHDRRCFGEIKNLHTGPVTQIVFKDRPNFDNMQTLMLSAGGEKNLFQVNLTDVQIDLSYKRYTSQLLCSFKTSPAGQPLSILPINKSIMVGCEDTSGILVWSKSWQQLLNRKSPLKTPQNRDYQLTFPNICPQLMTIDALVLLEESKGFFAIKISQSQKLLSQLTKEKSDFTYPGVILIAQFFDWNGEAEVLRKLDFCNSNSLYSNLAYLPMISVLIAGDELGRIWCYDVSGILLDRLDNDQNIVYPVDGILPFPKVFEDKLQIIKDSTEENLTKLESIPILVKDENDNSEKSVPVAAYINSQTVKQEAGSDSMRIDYNKTKFINGLAVNRACTAIVSAFSCNLVGIYKHHVNLDIPIEESEDEGSGDEMD